MKPMFKNSHKMSQILKTTNSVSHIIKVQYIFSVIDVSVKYKDLRLEIIRETFKDLTGKWDRNFVIYPISSQEDIKLMM